MQLKSYWMDTAPRFDQATSGPVSGTCDVVIVGGGFTGLSAARSLARSGADVVVLEAQHVGYGGSGRNGGHLNNGLAHSFAEAMARFGADKAVEMYRAFDDSVDLIETIVAEERLDCDFRRAGKLKLASKPAHMFALEQNFQAINQHVDPETSLLDMTELRKEIQSSAFHGAMLSQKSAMMHMGKFVTGLANAAVTHGARIFEATPVTERKREGAQHIVQTPRGNIRARDVVVATGAYTSGPFDYFRKRVVPIGSFVIATQPLSAAQVANVVPGNRTHVTTLNIGNYFRLSPDQRLIFGGRARFSARTDTESDRKSAEILRTGMLEIFPQLSGVDVDYCWGGLVGMTSDRFPRAGIRDDLHFSMGYSGHGAQMSVLMGSIIADTLSGKSDRNPWGALEWKSIPGYAGKPWFLPLVGLYYKTLDKIR